MLPCPIQNQAQQNKTKLTAAIVGQVQIPKQEEQKATKEQINNDRRRN